MAVLVDRTQPDQRLQELLWREGAISDLVPIDPTQVLDEEGKTRALKVLDTVIRLSTDAFDNLILGNFQKFNALVGDNACIIRAFIIAIEFASKQGQYTERLQNCISKFKAIGDRIKAVKEAAKQSKEAAVRLHGRIQSFKNNSKSMSPIELEAAMADILAQSEQTVKMTEQVSAQVDDVHQRFRDLRVELKPKSGDPSWGSYLGCNNLNMNLPLLFKLAIQSYVLCLTKTLAGPKEKSNPALLAEKYGISNKCAHDVVQLFREVLSASSVGYVQCNSQILNPTPYTSELAIVANKFQRFDKELNRTTLPCFAVMEILWPRYVNSNLPMLFLIQTVDENDKSVIFPMFFSAKTFEYVPHHKLTEEQQKSYALIVKAESGLGVKGIEEFLSKQESLYTALILGEADHPQFPGKATPDPTAAELERAGVPLYSEKWSISKEQAKKEGFSPQNRSKLYTTHYFCSRVITAILNVLPITAIRV